MLPVPHVTFDLNWSDVELDFTGHLFNYTYIVINMYIYSQTILHYIHLLIVNLKIMKLALLDIIFL